MDQAIYRMLVEQTTDYALLVLDSTGHIMTWNRGAERLKGYAADEIVGRHFSVFYTKQACESGARSKAAGFDLHLAKPVVVEELESLLALPIDPHAG